jgi:thiamine pyrophosphate-dependent acetolactate synthase large subunit-like protein
LWKDVTCYLGKPLVDFAGLAKSFGIDGQQTNTPAEFRKALKRGTAALREGRPYLIDAVIMQLDRRGVRTEQTWYPQISIAAGRTRKV